MEIRIAKNDNEINSCFETMSQLRPHIKKRRFSCAGKEAGKI
ncbi:MAG: hypothetical protein ABID83_05080 [Candidatus Omnitrophota bacterium]